jgi:hypothetical protein
MELDTSTKNIMLFGLYKSSSNSFGFLDFDGSEDFTGITGLSITVFVSLSGILLEASRGFIGSVTTIGSVVFTPALLGFLK